MEWKNIKNELPDSGNLLVLESGDEPYWFRVSAIYFDYELDKDNIWFDYWMKLIDEPCEYWING